MSVIHANAQNEIDINDTISLTYYSSPGCSICHEKEIIVDNFVDLHPSVNFSKVMIITGENHTNFNDYLISIGLEADFPPYALFEKGGFYYGMASPDITLEDLELIYDRLVKLEGPIPDWEEREITPWIAFVSGLVTGISPCVILVTAVVSSALLVQDGNIKEEKEIHDNEEKEGNLEEKEGNLEEKKHVKNKFYSIFLGFLLGVFLMYLLLGIVLFTALEFLSSTFFGSTIRIIFAVIMFILGAWYILDTFNENSKLFSTPKWVKDFVKRTAKKGTFVYSFLLGFIFSFLKIPCVAGIMVALVYGISSNTAQFLPSLIMFYVGLLIPLVFLMVILGKGVQTNKIHDIRIKYRPHIRIISGLLIIGLTIYSLWL